MLNRVPSRASTVGLAIWLRATSSPRGKSRNERKVAMAKTPKPTMTVTESSTPICRHLLSINAALALEQQQYPFLFYLHREHNDLREQPPATHPQLPIEPAFLFHTHPGRTSPQPSPARPRTRRWQ